MRQTKIICTIGPSSDSDDGIRGLIGAGMDVARLNMSHGDLDRHRQTVKRIVKAREALGKPVAIMLDTQGAEIRTGDRSTPLPIRAGQEVLFSPVPVPDSTLPVITVNYEHFDREVQEAERILLDNGEMSFDVVRMEPGGGVVARSRDEGTVGSRRHVNLPGANLDLASVTEKDWTDIRFAIEAGLDCIALSFVREAADVTQVKDFLASQNSDIFVFAKIETPQAVSRIEEIIRVSDGIMVARGDLGAEVPFERVPIIQDTIVRLCREQGKPVIVATHMLESMIEQPMPTRAEVTDIAHAATTGTDATMLSGETAGGKHPVASVEAMDRVLRATEEHLHSLNTMQPAPILNMREARAEAAVKLAQSTNAEAIIVITRTGRTGRDIAKFRPSMPILAFTLEDAVQRQLNFSFGLVPGRIDFSDDPEQTVQTALHHPLVADTLTPGGRVIIVADVRTGGGEMVHAIQMRTVPKV